MQAGASVTGNRYLDNYDTFVLADTFSAVADGMGDGPGSAFASRTAIARFAQDRPDSPAALRDSVAATHAQVRAFARDQPGLVGCTFTGFSRTARNEAWIVHIGDSRAYRLRDGLLELLTSDHAAAWVGLLHGSFPYGSPAAQAARYRLTRYIGHPAVPDPDILNVTLRPGDVYFLCTDGVSDQVPYERLAEILTDPPADAVNTILTATLTAGGHDNATALAIRI